jgi:hypothetical protein
MRANTIQFALMTLAASVAPGQSTTPATVEKVFRFTSSATTEDIQEVATAIRAIGDIRQVSAVSWRTITVRGTAGQVALAEWLFTELDRTSPGPTSPQEFRLSGSDEVARVFFLTHTQTPQDLQEVATVVRSMAEIRRLFTYNTAKAITLRGTAGEIALAEWLIQELDQPRQTTAPHEYRLAGADDIARVFFLSFAVTPRDLQEVATLVRSMGEIRRMFTNNVREPW